MGLVERRLASARIGSRYYTVAKHRDWKLKEAILSRMPSGGRFLDAGCGRNLMLSGLVGERCSLAVGVDLEPMKSASRGIHGVLSDLHELGLASGAFDVAALRSVSEHLERPDEVFLEIARVLRPGGAVVILCPNKWYYSSVIGRMVPERAAGPILKLIYGKNVYDNFPTYYRANTRRSVRRLAQQAGLEVEVAAVCEHPPDYLKLSPVLFQLGVWYDRITVRFRPFQFFAVSFLFVLRKPGPERAAVKDAP